MAQVKYNDYAAALKFELINNSDDIGKWEMAYKENKQFGEGITEFLMALGQFPQDQITVVFVKNLNAFEYLGENYIDYSGNQFFASIRNDSLTSINFFSLFIDERTELRNWDQFLKDEEDTIEFLRKIDQLKVLFAYQRDTKHFGFEKNFRSTMAKDMEVDIKYKNYLYAKWNYNNVQELAPKCQEELDLYIAANKGGYYMINEKYVDKVVENVYSFDSSSSHISLMARKDYPYGGFEREEDVNKQIEIIKEGYYTWIGKFCFSGIKQEIPLPLDLLKYGHIVDGEYMLVLTSVDWDWFKRVYKWEELRIMDFFYSKKRSLEKNYARMIQRLYEEKEGQEKGTFAKEIFKFRAELPFGQSIKTPTYLREAVYSDSTNTFAIAWKDKEEFEIVEKRLKKRDYPYQYGLWTVAYSRAELINLILRIGIDNVIYADTDCVKFIGKENLKVMEEYNREITREFNRIDSRRKMDLGNKIGRWKDEGLLKRFKAIGIKWYLTEDQENELEVKCSGANKELLGNYLRKQEDPFEEFSKDLYVEGLFKQMCYMKDKEVRFIRISNQAAIPDSLVKEMDKYSYNMVMK